VEVIKILLLWGGVGPVSVKLPAAACPLAWEADIKSSVGRDSPLFASKVYCARALRPLAREAGSKGSLGRGDFAS